MKKLLFSIVFTLAILIGLMVAFSTGVSADPGHGFDGYPGSGNGGSGIYHDQPQWHGQCSNHV